MRIQGWVGVVLVGLGIGCGSSSTGVMTGPEMSTQKGAGGQGGQGGARGDAGDPPTADAGDPVGNPGFGGFPGGEVPSCSVLETQYAQTVADAQSCDVNGGGQCQGLVAATLSPCPSCMTFVNNAAIVDAIAHFWMQAGCASQPAQGCPTSTCSQPTSGTCVASSSGGICSSN